jgi:hypothetical protein
MRKLFKEWKDYKFYALVNMWKKEGYSEEERTMMNKTIFEFGVIIAAIALGGMTHLMDDDDDGWLTNELALQITRFGADISQFISPADFIRVVRNPAVSINLIEKWGDWGTQLFTHPFAQYQRASGFAKKGDNKLWIKTQKLIPAWRQVINFMTPEEQIKFYNLTGSAAR